MNKNSAMFACSLKDCSCESVKDNLYHDQQTLVSKLPRSDLVMTAWDHNARIGRLSDMEVFLGTIIDLIHVVMKMEIAYSSST